MFAAISKAATAAAGGVLAEVELEDTKILWPGGVLQYMEEEKHMRMVNGDKINLIEGIKEGGPQGDIFKVHMAIRSVNILLHLRKIILGPISAKY